MSSDVVVGVFVGFDDNRSLGSGETGAATPVPIFMDFMTAALKQRPAREFVRPRNAIFRTVNGIEEAFRPGTERRVVEAPVDEVREGPQAYNDVLRREAEARAAAAAAAAGAPPPVAAPAPPPAKKEPAEDLSGLY